jgi:hypothetical protein
MSGGRPLRKLFAVATAVAGGIIAAGLFTPGPAGAAASADLKVTVTTTPAKAAYAVGDAVTTTFTITNVGDAPATNVRDSGGREQGVTRTTDLPIEPFDLAPGASHTIDWTGVVDQVAFVAGYAKGTWEFTNDAGEANAADNAAWYRLEVPGGKGTVRLKVFVDVRGDFDGGQPGLPGAEVVVRGETGAPSFSGTTDASGRLTLSGLPVGQDYIASVTGWTIRGDERAGYLQVLAGRTLTAELALVPRNGPTPTASASVSTSASPSAPVSPSESGSPEPSGAAGGGVAVTPSASPIPAGGLARTGSSTAPVLGAGAAVVAAGAVAIVAAYRRRHRFVIPD